MTCALSGCLVLAGVSFAAEYSNDANYQSALSYLNSSNYTMAISALEKSLKSYPSNRDVRDKLINAYYSNANKTLNSGVKLDSALKDYRMALYYLKYFSADSLSQGDLIKADALDSQIKAVLTKQQKGVSCESRFKEAKRLRGMGQFAPAVVEFNEALKSPSFARASYEALGDIMMAISRPIEAAKNYDECLKMNSKDAQMHLKLARALHKIGSVDLALQEYNLAMSDSSLQDEIVPALEQLNLAKVNKNPQDVSSYLSLGDVYQKQGDYVNAINYYSKAQQLDPSNSSAIISVASVQTKQGNYNQALETYDSLLAQNPNNEVVHYDKAVALRGLKQYQPAMDELIYALRIDPDYEEAKILLLKIIDEDLSMDESLDKLSRLVVANPKDETVIMVYANKLYRAKRDIEAIEQYKTVIALNPKNIDAYINEARLYDRNNDPINAMAVINAGLSANPANTVALNKVKKEISDKLASVENDRALNLYDKGDYQGALNIFLTDKNPSEDTLMNIGGCYYEIQNYDKSIEYYNKVLFKNPRNDRALLYLGGNYYSKGDTSKAIDFYKKALALKPGDKDIKEALSIANQNLGDDLLEKALNSYNAGKFNETFAALNKVISLNPQNAYAYYYRGLIYDEWKKYAQAIADYKKAVQYMPDMELAYYSLAVDYDTLNDTTNARVNYQKFLSMSQGKDTYTDYARTRLSELSKVGAQKK